MYTGSGSCSTCQKCTPRHEITGTATGDEPPARSNMSVLRGTGQGVGRGWAVGWGAENKSGGLKNEEIWVGLGARTVIGIKPRELLQGLPGV